MPDDERPYRQSLAVGAKGQVKLCGRWLDAEIVSKTERGKSEHAMARTSDGTMVMIGSSTQWRPTNGH